MKKPRVNDFDPNAQDVPELKSSLDKMPVIQRPKLPDTETKTSPAQLVTHERVNARSPVRPNGKRIITRNSFEIYEDQMDSLRKISLQEKMEGKLGSMSQMVRDAIDGYLKEKSPTQ